MIIQGDQQIAAKQGDSGELEVKLNGSLVAAETNKAVTADNNILTTGYTASNTKTSILLVKTNASGILSLMVDGVSGPLNGGQPLDIDNWYAFEIPIVSTSVYNLKLSADATMQIKWGEI
jgi:hypothetical protein